MAADSQSFFSRENLALDKLRQLGTSFLGKKHSPRQLASTLSDELGLAVEQGLVNSAIDLLAPDVMDVVSRICSSDDYIDLNCLVARFLSENSVGNTRVLWSDTARTTARGAGTIDLAAETVDIAI